MYDQRHLNDFSEIGDNKHQIFSGRIFALILIGIASLYLLIMICQAYVNNRQLLMSSLYESDYDYQTESYDFRPY